MMDEPSFFRTSARSRPPRDERSQRRHEPHGQANECASAVAPGNCPWLQALINPSRSMRVARRVEGGQAALTVQPLEQAARQEEIRVDE
jgi:hypothetical protein